MTTTLKDFDRPHPLREEEDEEECERVHASRAVLGMTEEEPTKETTTRNEFLSEEGKEEKRDIFLENTTDATSTPPKKKNKEEEEVEEVKEEENRKHVNPILRDDDWFCLLYTSPSPRDDT